MNFEPPPPKKFQLHNLTKIIEKIIQKLTKNLLTKEDLIISNQKKKFNYII